MSNTINQKLQIGFEKSDNGLSFQLSELSGKQRSIGFSDSNKDEFVKHAIYWICRYVKENVNAIK